jgi:hypothetical protein
LKKEKRRREEEITYFIVATSGIAIVVLVWMWMAGQAGIRFGKNHRLLLPPPASDQSINKGKRAACYLTGWGGVLVKMALKFLNSYNRMEEFGTWPLER